MKKIIALLMAILMLSLCFVSCSKEEEKDEEKDNGAVDAVNTESETDDFPNIPAQDNGGRDFVILYPEWALYDRYYLAEETTGEMMNDVNYERQLNINNHLGIKIVGKAGGTIQEVATDIKNAALSQEGIYDLSLIHCFVGVRGLGLDGCLADWSTIESVNLNASYWRGDSMKNVAIGQKQYYATGSFILYDPALILFNKDTVNTFPDFKDTDLYEHVRNKTWTIEQMKTYASSVATDLNKDLPDGEGKYGFACQLNWEVNAFMSASGYTSVTSNGNGTYTLNSNVEKLDNLYLAVKDLMKADFTYSWAWSQTSEEIGVKIMKEGRAMFMATGISPALKIISNSDAKIGILPYPSLTVNQDYSYLDWAGYLVMPVSVTNPELAGAVAELLCYYGDKLVYPAFYDKLLGQRTAENMADAEMLDIIFDSLIMDPGLAFCEGSDQMQNIFYALPNCISANANSVSSYIGSNSVAAGIHIDFEMYT